jgi:hypothetical protein
VLDAESPLCLCRCDCWPEEEPRVAGGGGGRFAELESERGFLCRAGSGLSSAESGHSLGLAPITKKASRGKKGEKLEDCERNGTDRSLDKSSFFGLGVGNRRSRKEEVEFIPSKVSLAYQLCPAPRLDFFLSASPVADTQPEE